jgi:hypothetical protein
MRMRTCMPRDMLPFVDSYSHVCTCTRTRTRTRTRTHTHTHARALALALALAHVHTQAKAFDMFPFVDKKPRWDEYGEVIRPEDYMIEDPAEAEARAAAEVSALMMWCQPARQRSNRSSQSV